MKICIQCNDDVEIYFKAPNGDIVCATERCYQQWLKDECEKVYERSDDNEQTN